MNNKKEKFNEGGYTGILAEPMTKIETASSILLDYDTPDVVAANEALYLKELSEKYAALFKHYDLNISDEGSKILLILRMAFVHVRGFRPAEAKRKRGAPEKWMGKMGIDLYTDVLKITKGDEGQIKRACIALSKEGKYKPHSANTLKTRFYEVKREHSILKCLSCAVKNGLISQSAVDDSLIEASSYGTDKPI